MRIAIDAKQYFRGPVSTKIILQNLLPKLFELYSEHEWIIFLDKKDKDLEFPFKQKNITVVYVWTPMNMLSNIFVLPSYIKRERADVTLFQMFIPFVKKSRSVAFIHDVLFHDFPQFFTWKERLYFCPLSWLTPHADKVICTTGYVADKLVQYRYISNKSAAGIAPLGASPGFKPVHEHDPALLSTVKNKFNLPEKYILFVGRLNVRKNIETLLRSIPLLKNHDIQVVIVGKENWKAPDLEKLLQDKAIAQRIILTGEMTDAELKATYAMATVFCFPSFAEGFGLPPLEAMASGVPVVVSNTTSLPEVCGNAALYIDPHSAESIAAALNNLMKDPALYKEMQQAGLERAAAFTWERTARSIMNIITGK